MQLTYLRRLISGTLAMYAAVLSTMSASAQIASSNRAALAAKGCGPANFKALESTQIGSNYTFYSDWIGCVRDVAGIVIMNDITDGRISIAFGQCNDKALSLRAALARSMGLNQATRVVALLNTNLGMEVRQQMDNRRSRNTLPNTPIANRQYGNWFVQKGDDGKCLASVRMEGMADNLRLIGFNGSVKLLLRTNLPQPAIGAFSPDRITIGHYPAPTIMDGRFQVIQLEGSNWLSGQLSVQDIPYLRRGGTIDIEDLNRSRSGSREPDATINNVLDVILRC